MLIIIIYFVLTDANAPSIVRSSSFISREFISVHRAQAPTCFLHEAYYVRVFVSAFVDVDTPDADAPSLGGTGTMSAAGGELGAVDSFRQ
jgi:hypothetical protein